MRFIGSSTGRTDMSRRDERNAQILARRATGETYSAIGADYELSRQRVEQIVAAAGKPRRSEPARREAYVVRVERTDQVNWFRVSAKDKRVIATTVFSDWLGGELGSDERGYFLAEHDGQGWAFVKRLPPDMSSWDLW
jgi:hypothetical protein